MYVLQVRIFLVKVIVLGRYLFVYKFYNSLLQVFLDGFWHVWLWILRSSQERPMDLCSSRFLILLS